MEQVLNDLIALNEKGIEYIPLKNSNGEIIDILIVTKQGDE